MIEADPPLVTTFVLYLILMIGIGIWVYRRTNSLGEYVLGGRSLRPSVAALSAGASDMSGWLLLGLPGAVYAAGIGATWIAIGLLIGTYLNWKLVAPRLRTYTELANDSVSLSSYFEERFEDRTRLLRIISAVVIIVFFTVYVSSGLVASGLLFSATFGWSPAVAMTIGLIFVVAYTVLGGFLADSFSDVVQGTMMFFALLLLPIIALFTLGGFGALTDSLNAKTPALLDMGNEASFANGEWGVGTALGAVTIISGLAWGLGYFGQPHILARFMGIRSVKDVPTARRISIGWVGLSLLGACAMGLLGIALIKEPLSDPETVFIVMAEQLTNPWIAGILQAAILAAIMSTVDSQLIVVSTALTQDFYHTFFAKDASRRRLLWTGRGAVIVVAIVAYALALQGGAVLDIVAYAWAGFGAAFGPVIILSLFWPRMTWAGALAGMITGAVVVLTWQFVDKVLGTGLYELVPGFAAATIAALVFGKYVGQPPQRSWTGAMTERSEPEAPATVTAELRELS